jgi:hypothetical protein
MDGIGLTVNCVGSPLALINVSSEGSHVPRSAKYLGEHQIFWGIGDKIIAYSKVLNTVSTIETKNPMASNACCDLRTEIYMTSIVLGV